MSDEVVARYKAQKPTRANSRDVVKQIAAERELSEAKVRSILVKAGVYVFLPKDKSKIEDQDYGILVKKFAEYGGPEGDPYFGPDELMTDLSRDFGYGKWTIADFYRRWKDAGKPADFAAMDMIERPEHHHVRHGPSATRAQSAAFRQLDMHSRLARASRPQFSSGIFNPMIATFVLMVLVVCGILSLFKS